MGNNMRLSVHGALPCYHGFIAKHSCVHANMHACMFVSVVLGHMHAVCSARRSCKSIDLHANMQQFCCSALMLLIVAPHAPTVVRTAERCVHAHVRTAERCAPTIVHTAKRCVRAHAHTAERCAHVHASTAKRCREDSISISCCSMHSIAIACMLTCTFQNNNAITIIHGHASCFPWIYHYSDF